MTTSQRKTSPHLINDEPLILLPNIACAFGVDEAIFLQKLHGWLRRSRHEIDGRVWIYNKLPQWVEQFPFFHERRLQRIIANLRDAKIIIISQEYNPRPTDRTNWYTIDYEELDKQMEAWESTQISHDDKIASSKTTKRRQDDDKTSSSIIRNTKDLTYIGDDATASRAASQADTPSPPGGGTSENPPADTEGGEKKGGPAKNKGANATLTEHPLNQAFHSLHANWPSHLQMKMIMESAPPLDNWIRAMREWSGRGYRYNNIKAQLEWAHNPALMERERPTATGSNKKSIYAKPEEVIVEDPNDIAEMKRWFEEAYPEKEE